MFHFPDKEEARGGHGREERWGPLWGSCVLHPISNLLVSRSYFVLECHLKIKLYCRKVPLGQNRGCKPGLRSAGRAPLAADAGMAGDPSASLPGARKAAVRSPPAQTRHVPSLRGIRVSGEWEGAFALERRKVKANTLFVYISKIGKTRARSFSEKWASGGEQGGKGEPGADFPRGCGPWKAGGQRRAPRRSGLWWRDLAGTASGRRGSGL